MTRLLLVPSPLLGPATWEPVAGVLERLGHQATIGTHDGAPVLAGAVLVVHSNAGYWAPALAQRGAAAATVYVDAALPAHDATDTVLAPPGFRAFLAGLADGDGLLPPWTGWWGDEATDGLFPDEATRARVEAEQPRLPPAWFDQRVPVPAGWAERPSAYVGFGDTYAEEQAFATAHGWPVTRLDGGHLHQLHDPVGVATAILDAAGR